MKKLALIALAALSLTLTSCVFNVNASTQTGERSAKEYSLRGFNSLEVSGDFIVNVAQGPYNVFLDIPAEFEQYLHFHIHDKKLHLSYENVPVKLRRLLNRKDFRSVANISLPDVKGIDVLGACDLKAIGLDVRELDIDCQGACKMEVEGSFGDLDVECSGATSLLLSGNAESFEVDCEGASKVKAAELICEKASVELNGASYASVRAIEHLDLECNGASKIEYKVEDDTIVRIESSGASKIVRVH